MTSMTAGRWWERARDRFVRHAETADHFAPDRLDRHRQLIQSAIPLALALLLMAKVNLFLDGDTGWHLGAGHWILENGYVPRVDPFSHTFPGTAWTAHEWLAEIIMVGAEAVAGWAALTALFGLTYALTMWLIAREAFRYLPARWALVACLLSGGMLMGFTLARPHMLAWPLLAGWTIILLRAREKNMAPPLAAALLMVIWANLHASYMFGFGLAGLFGLESLIANRRDGKLFLRWLLFGVASLAAAAFLTPLGPAHFLYPFQVSNMEALSIIGEWRRSLPQSDPLLYISLLGLVLLLRHRWRDTSPLRLLLIAGLCVMALAHARHQMLFAIVGTLVFLPMINPARQPDAPLGATRWLLPALAVLVLGRLLIPYQFMENGTYPLTLLSKVPAEIRAKPVYNEYSQGGPLVMLGIRPYIDGRADMFGDAFTFRARAITNGDIVKFREDAKRFNIGWVLLEQDDELRKKLLREPGWRVLGQDKHAIVFVRR